MFMILLRAHKFIIKIFNKKRLIRIRKSFKILTGIIKTPII